MSVPDYTSAQWAEMAGVDVAVLGDSLAMIAHGHRNTVPATMDMMVMHGAGGAPRRAEHVHARLHAVPELQHGRPRARQRRRASCRRPLCDAVKPQGGKSQAHILKALVDAGIPTASHIGLTPHTIAMFGGFKIQGRTADAAMKILEDALAIEDAGCFMLEFEAVPAKIAKLISEQLTIPTIGIGAGVGMRRADPALLRSARRVHRLQAEIHQALRQADRSRRRRHQAICQGSEGRHVPRRRPLLHGERGRIREIRRDGRETQADLTWRAIAGSACASVRTRRWRRNGLRAARETLTEQAYRADRGADRHAAAQARATCCRSRCCRRCSRSAARRSAKRLQRLAREGLITILPRKGILVSDINPRNQLLVLEVRREIERLLSRAGAERATEEQREQLQEIARGHGPRRQDQ